jgi:uncharacterized protein (TIGR01777 family)
MQITVAGATGLIGRALITALRNRGDELIVLSRDPGRVPEWMSGVTVLGWRPVLERPPAEALEGVDAVVNLAGAPIFPGRWTESRMRTIRESRVAGNRNLAEAIAELDRPPRTSVVGSAVGYYGSRGEEELVEEAPPGSDFLAGVCRDLEEEAQAATRAGVRVVRLRTGIVMAPSGGALEQILPLFRAGLGGRLGSGRQWFSWIHISDMVRVILRALDDDGIEGPVNATAPHPVRNVEFAKALGKALRRPAIMWVPASLLRVALGKTASVILSSQRVVPVKLSRAGHEFDFGDIQRALVDCVSDSRAA